MTVIHPPARRYGELAELGAIGRRTLREGRARNGRNQAQQKSRQEMTTAHLGPLVDLFVHYSRACSPSGTPVFHGGPHRLPKEPVHTSGGGNRYMKNCSDAILPSLTS